MTLFKFNSETGTVKKTTNYHERESLKIWRHILCSSHEKLERLQFTQQAYALIKSMSEAEQVWEKVLY